MASETAKRDDNRTVTLLGVTDDASADIKNLLIDPTTGRLKVSAVITGGTTDSDAIHDNVASEISAITEKASPASADIVIIEDSADSYNKKKVQVGNLPDTGEINTASNVGVGGVGVFKQKTGVDLEFKNINAGSNKITITDDTTNNEVDIDIAEANLTLSNIGGSVTDAQVPNTITLDDITQITARSHTDLSDIGTNTHAQLDTHLASTANPHSVTAAQAGALANVVEDTTPQLGGELDAQANSIGFTLQTYTGVVGTTAIDWTNGNKAKFTFGAGNETLTFTAPSKPCAVQLIIVQDATGSRTITWPAAVKWPGGTAPTLSTAASAVDIVSFLYDGTNYYGTSSLNFS